jgi:hypothetical protein
MDAQITRTTDGGVRGEDEGREIRGRGSAGAAAEGIALLKLKFTAASVRVVFSVVKAALS